MSLKIIPVVVLVLSSCQSMQSDDPSALSFRIPDGSTLTLNKDLDIAEGYTHALLQAGKLMTESNRNLYEISCRLDVRTFGPRTLEPEVFRIRRTEDGQRRISDAGIWLFFSEIYLDSDKGTDVIMLRCQSWGYGMNWHFSVAEMKPALGDYFTFTFPKPEPAKSAY